MHQAFKKPLSAFLSFSAASLSAFALTAGFISVSALPAFASEKPTGHHVRKLARENAQIQGNSSLEDMMTLQRNNDSLQNAIRPPKWEQNLETENLDFNEQMTAKQVQIKQEQLSVTETETKIAALKQAIANSKTRTDADASRTIAQGDLAKGMADSYRKGRSKNTLYSAGGALDVVPVRPGS